MLTTKANNEDLHAPRVERVPKRRPSQDFDAARFRNWYQIEQQPVSSKKVVSVMSYNLLSQHYMWEEVFGCLNKNCLDWESYRFPLLSQTIRQFHSDIICLQELEAAVYQQFWRDNFPNEDYSSVYVRKSLPPYWGKKCAEFIDGVGIFVNTKRFDIKRHQEVHFSDFIKNNPTMFELSEDLYQRLIPRNNVGMIVELYDKWNDEIVYVANTHLYWSPKYCDVKLVQTKLLLDILHDFISDPDPNIIICGDLNSKFDSSVFQFLHNPEFRIDTVKDFDAKGEISKFYNHPIDGVLRNPFNLTYPYLPLVETKKLTFTSYATDLKEILDHIWFSTGKFKTIRLLGEVNQSYMKDIIGFPTLEFPSDHIPLYVELAYSA